MAATTLAAGILPVAQLVHESIGGLREQRPLTEILELGV
jgi:hypothetical protein